MPLREFEGWQETGQLLSSPANGIGKPEPLKHALAECRARRITGGHRLVYLGRTWELGPTLVVWQCRYHY